jgi:hypothetical protein
MNLKDLAKEFNDEIKKQEGYDPIGEEWILVEFQSAIKINDELRNCGNCLYWEKPKPSYKTGELVAACKKMKDCFCCNHDKQTGGAVGGGHFESKITFYCNQWRIDSRNKI